MSFPMTKASIGLSWGLMLATALWIALATASLAAWAVVAFIALLPPVMVMVMANTPARSVAEIIRDVEAGSPR